MHPNTSKVVTKLHYKISFDRIKSNINTNLPSTYIAIDCVPISTLLIRCGGGDVFLYNLRLVISSLPPISWLTGPYIGR